MLVGLWNLVQWRGVASPLMQNVTLVSSRNTPFRRLGVPMHTVWQITSLQGGFPAKRAGRGKGCFSTAAICCTAATRTLLKHTVYCTVQHAASICLANLWPFVQRLRLFSAYEVVQWQRSRSDVSGALPAQLQKKHWNDDCFFNKGSVVVVLKRLLVHSGRSSANCTRHACQLTSTCANELVLRARFDGIWPPDVSVLRAIEFLFKSRCNGGSEPLPIWQ